MAASNTKLMAYREQRDAERAKARRAREDARVAKREKKAARLQARADRRALVKQYGKLALVFGAAVAAGATIGGQLTRVDRPWMGKVQAGLIVVGLLVIAMAKARTWLQVAGITLISMGGVKLSDLSRSRDWIPGDNAWERPIPPAGAEGYTIEVVPNDG